MVGNSDLPRYKAVTSPPFGPAQRTPIPWETDDETIPQRLLKLNLEYTAGVCLAQQACHGRVALDLPSCWNV